MVTRPRIRMVGFCFASLVGVVFLHDFPELAGRIVAVGVRSKDGSVDERSNGAIALVALRRERVRAVLVCLGC